MYRYALRQSASVPRFLYPARIESLAKNIPEAQRIRFFMTFGQSYLDHMRCLEDVGMLSTTPVSYTHLDVYKRQP